MSNYPHKTSVKYDPDLNQLCVEWATQADLDAIRFPDGMESLIVQGVFDRLTIPAGVEAVYATSCGLREITVPDSVKILRCENNSLRTLELPAGIVEVDASYNHQLGVVSFRGPPTALVDLDLKSTALVGLDFDAPDTLEEIKMQHCMRLEDGGISERARRGLVRDVGASRFGQRWLRLRP